MSQYFDYFVCNESQMEEWADAVGRFDEAGKEKLQKAMPIFYGFKNLGYDGIGILAQCENEKVDDPFKYVSAFNIAKSINELEGPWIVKLNKDVIEIISYLTVSKELVNRWRKYEAEFSGYSIEESRVHFTSEEAEKIIKMCKLAMKKKLPVYCCFYG